MALLMYRKGSAPVVKILVCITTHRLTPVYPVRNGATQTWILSVEMKSL